MKIARARRDRSVLKERRGRRGLSVRPVSNGIIVTGLAAGSHTVSLVASPGTSTDFNDYFDATAIEFD